MLISHIPGTWRALSLFVVSSSLLLVGCSKDGSANGETMASAGASASAVDQSLEDRINDQPIEAERVTLVVYGMSCPLCATNVDKQLLAVNGVENVDVDLSTGKIGVALAASPKPTTRQLASAVTKSGFTLVDIKLN